jgi:peptidoglycan/LPS O-acetylase OafA/YrhL
VGATVNTSGQTIPRRAALDGIRTVAILGVIVFHYHDALPTRGGFLGVQLFFVLSGFLITSILTAEFESRSGINFVAFYVRRAWRLLPALALVLGAVSLYALTLSESLRISTYQEIAATIAYSDNWFQAFAHPPQTVMGHAWSLSVEEQFYLLWPGLLVLALRRGGRRAALVLAMGGAAAAMVVRAVEWEAGVNVRYVYDSLEGRTDGLLIGAALALLARQWRPGRAVFMTACTFILASFAFAGDGTFLYVFGLPLFSLAAAVLIAGVLHGKGRVKRVLESRPAVWLGVRSYGVYLWQQPIYIALHDHLAGNVAAIVISLPVTLAAAAASHRYVEQPLLTRARRRRSRIVVPETAPVAA